MTNKYKSLSLLILAIIACLCITGCGGGGGRSPASDTGSASLTITWASGGAAADLQSVRIAILDGSTTLDQKVVKRPLTGSSSVVSIANLPAGRFTAHVTGYGEAGGAGTILLDASSEIVIVKGQVADLSFTASGTIDAVFVTAPVTSLRTGQTETLIASPVTDTNEIVMVAPGSIIWNSDANGVATVDADGTVTAISAGSAEITATETGSGQSGSITISVVGAKWTVMVYMAADNNLETYGIKDFNELETVGSSDDVSVIVQMDRSASNDTSNGNWTGARRYLVTKDSDTNTINSEMLQDLGTTNMADPQTLRDFIQYATTNYSAEHYLLVVWDHGRGWRNRALALNMPRAVKAICVDDTADDEMSLPELETALTQAHHSDIILFDACLMGMLEVAYSVRNCADIMVASEENVPVQGQPYGRLMSRLAENPSISAFSLSIGIVDDYIDNYVGSTSTFTMSAVNLLALDGVVTASDQLASSFITNLPEVKNCVETAQASAQHYDFDSGTYDDYRDLYDFARLVNQNVSNQQVRTAAHSVMSAVNTAVIHEAHAGSQVGNSHGLSIYLPSPHQSLSAYSTTQFAGATQWDEMITAY